MPAVFLRRHFLFDDEEWKSASGSPGRFITHGILGRRSSCLKEFRKYGTSASDDSLVQDGSLFTSVVVFFVVAFIVRFRYNGSSVHSRREDETARERTDQWQLALVCHSWEKRSRYSTLYPLQRHGDLRDWSSSIIRMKCKSRYR